LHAIEQHPHQLLGRRVFLIRRFFFRHGSGRGRRI